jgi:hypothetical protein
MEHDFGARMHMAQAVGPHLVDIWIMVKNRWKWSWVFNLV